MIQTRQALIDALELYASDFPEEAEFRKEFLYLLKSERCFQRDHLPGHITGSAFIVDESRTRTLLTHHAKLNKWLQPGGHADGDENIFAVAIREALEETGLAVSVIDPDIFDIDIHTIPQRKDFPQHLHYDVRILVQASSLDKYQVTEESHDLAWVDISAIGSFTDNESILRMAKKVMHSPS